MFTTMAEKPNKRKKGAITEEDVSILLQRYSVKTVLILLHEVAQVAGAKIDWNEIVENTASGIPTARECQMLWRHLAYGESLTDKFDNAANPMDDDSDLEYEMEAIPAVNREASVEAATYVKMEPKTGKCLMGTCSKVSIASDHPIDFNVRNNSSIETPLTINVPKQKVPSDRSLLATAMQNTSATIPVSVEKQRLSSGTCERRPKDGKSGVDSAPQRKRKTWSAEDDVKLTAAVQKHGQNWANVASEDFCNDRKASELSQRWATIKKKKSNLNAGTSSELSEAWKATSRAILIALEPENLKAAHHTSNGTKSRHNFQNASALPPALQSGTVGPPKSRFPTERLSINCTANPNPMVQAAAVAAGARIATPADTSVIQAAARSTNVVHIRTGVGSSTSIPKQLFTTHSSLRGPTKTAVSTYSSTLPSLSPGKAQIAQGNSSKPAEFAVRSNPLGSAGAFDVLSEMGKATASPNTEVAKTVVATSTKEMKKLRERDIGAEELISEGQSIPIGNQSKQKVDEHQASALSNTLGGRTQGHLNQTQDDRVALPCSQLETDGKKRAVRITTSNGIHENTSSN